MGGNPAKSLVHSTKGALFNSMTIKRISANKWEVRVSVGGAHGRKQVRRTVLGSKDDARRVEAQLQISLGKTDPAEQVITLHDFVYIRWLPSIKVSGATRSGYERHLRSITGELGYLYLHQITPRHLEAYFNSFKSDGVAHKHYVTLRAALNTAVRWQMLEINPCSRIIAPRKPATNPPEVYSHEQIRLLMKEIEGQWFEPLWLLGVFCGLRPEESTALDVPPRDWDGTLEITRAYSHQGAEGWKLTRLKTDASKSTVFVPSEIASRILAITQGASGPLGRMKRSGKNGDRANREVFANAYKRFCESRGLPHIPPKNLRHTAATLMLGSGVSLAVVSKVLRHTQVSTTANAYLGIVDGAKQEAAELLASSVMGSITGT